jgi:hypothetical protein
MSLLSIILLPLIAAFIGWFTNWIAIKMLFHPKQPKRILGITFQGIFPKRQAQFAEKLGQIVANDLVNIKEIVSSLNSEDAVHEIKPMIEVHIDHFLNEKLPQKMPIISMFISKQLIAEMKSTLMDEIIEMYPQIANQMMTSLEKKISIQKMVSDKVAQFSSDKLESILIGIMQKEFKFVEIIGGVLGFIIGIIQVLLSQI